MPQSSPARVPGEAAAAPMQVPTAVSGACAVAVGGITLVCRCLSHLLFMKGIGAMYTQ